MFLAFVFAGAQAFGSAAAQTWTDKVTDTPSLVQTDFGAYGDRLPIDGSISCGETAITMSLLWLARNGYTQLATDSTDPAEVEASARNLIEIFQGLIDGAPVGPPIQDGAYYEYMVSTYLSLRGIGTDQVDISHEIAPDAAWIDQAIQNQSVAHVQAGWYEKNGDQLDRTGQHWWTPLAVDTGNPRLTINNPAPSAYYDVLDIPSNNPQILPITPLTPAEKAEVNPPLAVGWFLQIDTPIVNPTTQIRAILEVAWSVTIDPGARPGAGHTPAPFTLNGERYINVGDGTLEALARIEGDGGIRKLGNGSLILLDEDVSLGTNSLGQGTTVSRAATATPFGFGSVVLSGNAVLTLEPEDASPAAIAQTLASGTAQVTFEGGNVIALDRGGRLSQTLTIGGYTDGASKNLAQIGTGSLVIAPSDGIAALGGGAQRILVAGAAGNRPDNIFGAVAPSIIGQDNDATRSGRFLRYDDSSGFVQVAGVLASTTPISASTGETIYVADIAQSIAAGQTAAAHLLELRGHDVTGDAGSRLVLGQGEAGDQSGLILNGGSLAVPEVDFGAADLYVYTSEAGGTIEGGLSGSGEAVYFGPGTTTLTAASSYTGGTQVNRGTVVAAASSGAALGNGTVEVGDHTRLIVRSGAVVGEVRTDPSGRITLAGGTVGALHVAEGDYELQGGGILEGGGTVAGPATIFGTIRTGETPGTIHFSDHVEFVGGFVGWRLDALDTDPSNAGVFWNSYVIEGGMSTFGTEDNPFFFLPSFGSIPDPDSGDPFWTERHEWLFAELPNGIDEWYFEVGGGNFSSGYFWLEQLNDGNIYVTFTPHPVPPPVPPKPPPEDDANNDAAVAAITREIDSTRRALDRVRRSALPATGSVRRWLPVRLRVLNARLSHPDDEVLERLYRQVLEARRSMTPASRRIILARLKARLSELRGGE